MARYVSKAKNQFVLMLILGLLAGIITRLTDFFPNDDLWGFSSIATLFGFWMLTVTLVILYSPSNKKAAANVFVYLFSMSFSFYFLKYVLGLFLPKFEDSGFQWNLFILYSAFSLICALISYVLYFWNNNSKINSFLYALPVAGLAAESLGVGIYLFTNHTFLFQLIFDVASLLFLGFLFYKKSNNKTLYILTATIMAAVGYIAFYRSFL